MATAPSRYIRGVAAALLALGPAMGLSSALDLRDELDLQRPVQQETFGEHDVLVDQGEIEQSLSLPVGQVSISPAPQPLTDIGSIDVADFNNNVYALALRSDNGFGLGLASSGGMTLTGGFVTKDGLQVNVYFVRRVNELYNAARDIGIEDLPSRTVGLTVGWKF